MSIYGSFPVKDGLVGLWSPIDRTFRDQGMLGHHATPTGDVSWFGSGGQDKVVIDSNGKLSITDTPDLQLSECSIVVLVDLNYQATSNQRLVSKRDGGGNNYELLASSTANLLQAFGTNVTIPYVGSRFVAVTGVHGEKVNYYLDGSWAITSATNAAIVANDAPLLIGNFYTLTLPARYPIGMVALYNRAIVADEISKLNTYMLGRISPHIFPSRQYWDLGSWVPLGTSNQEIGTWDLGIITNNEIVDRSGNGYIGTISGGPSKVYSEVGRVLRNVNDDGAVSVGSPTSVSNDITIESLVLLRTSGGGGGGRVLDNIKQILFFSGTPNKITLILSGVTGTPFDVVDVSIGVNKWMHVVATRRQSDGAVKIYINGVEVLSETGGTEAIDISGAMTLLNFASIRALDGDAGFVRLLGKYFEASEAQSRYNKIARTVLFHETWELARPTITDATAGMYLDGTRWQVVTGVWAYKEDSDGTYLECITDGKIRYVSLSGASGWFTKTFEQKSGTPTLTKNTNDIEIDGVTGDQIGEILLTLGEEV